MKRQRSTIKATEHRVDLDTAIQPVFLKLYRQSLSMQEQTKTKIEKMLAAGVIETATNTWTSLALFAYKKESILRLCVDYWRLNTKTLSHIHQLFQVDECVDSLGNAGLFSMPNCSSVYWQFLVAERDKDKKILVRTATRTGTHGCLSASKTPRPPLTSSRHHFREGLAAGMLYAS